MSVCMSFLNAFRSFGFNLSHATTTLPCMAGIKQTSMPGVSITRHRDISAAANMITVLLMLAYLSLEQRSIVRLPFEPSVDTDDIPM